MSRWFRAGVVRQFQRLQLFRRDRGPRPFVRLVAVYAPSVCQFCHAKRTKEELFLAFSFFFWNYSIENSSVTFRLGLLVIGFTNELSILHQIELVPRVQLSRAKGARETSEMIDQLLRPAHDLRRCQSLAAARAFRPETPAIPTTYNIFTLRSCINRDTVAWIELH